MTFDISRIIESTGGASYGATADCEIKHFIFDSRSLAFPRSTMFVALRTDSADGHTHLASLCEAGVKAFMVETVPAWIEEYPDCTFLRVDNTFAALEKLASDARSRLRGKAVAITGSQGKTVVKEMMYAMAPDKVWRSPRSWNSRLGVPMSLLEADENAPVCVFEAGIDRPGDMDSLRRLIRPDVGVITSITREHGAAFASDSEKLDEKLRLFEDASVVAGNFSDPLIAEVVPAAFHGKQIMEMRGADILEADRLMAAAALEACGVSPENGSPDPVSNRLDVHEGVNECTIVFDGFTDDLRSLQASLDFMRRRSAPHLSTTVVLADMPSADADRLSRLLAAFGVRRVIAIGKATPEALKASTRPFAVEAIASVGEFVERYDINLFSSENILIFGGPSDRFRPIKQLLESARHDTIFEVNLDAIVHNFNEYRSMVVPSTGIVAMVKASAYGLGAVEIGRTLQSQGAAYLAVAVIDEGLELRRAGITMPVMVLNPVTTNYRALFFNRLEPSVFSIGELRTLVREARRAGVDSFRAHIKLDTGMHRVGFTRAELPALVEELSRSPELHVASIFSHLATADCPDQTDYTLSQLRSFEEMSSYLKERIPHPVKRHILNTAGIATHPEYQYDMVRLGIGLYGINPLPTAAVGLRPVAALRTTIISLKHWEAGTTIGYGRRGVLARPSVIATVPIGYADGLDRHLSRGAAAMKVRGIDCPIVGNICMDQCMIDVTDVPGASLGDPVEVFGDQIPVERLADTLDTIPYEILTSVSPRVKRIYFRD